MLDGYIYNALRTPFGRHAGALARMRPDDMLAAVVSEVVKQSPFDPEKIEDVVVGCANQAGEDSRCVARHAGLLAGLPIEVAGSVLQRNCGSGLNAIVMAAQAVTCGEGFVDLDHVDVGEAEAGTRERLLGSFDRADAHDPRRHSRDSAGDDAGERLGPGGVTRLAAGNDHRDGAVIDAGGIAGGRYPALLQRPQAR